MEDTDFLKRMLVPKIHRGLTKHTWVSFYNEEAEDTIHEFQSTQTSRQQNSDRLIPYGSREFKREWRKAREKTDLHITPRDLREWFCQQMGELSVPDRFIDAFCGRTPKSILARHYSDYSPERLKRIYDQAGLKVLS